VSWFAFVTTYSGYGRWLRTEVLVPLSLPSLATIGLLITNRHHQLIAHSFILDTSGPFILLHRSWGPWFYFIISYTYLLLLMGTVLLFRIYLRATTTERSQTGLLIIGIIFPWVGSLLDFLNVKPLYGFDFTPFGFLITGLIITWNIFFYRFGNIIPISYETAVSNMGDGVLVADPEGRVLTANKAAVEIFRHVETALPGRSLPELFPNFPSADDGSGDRGEARETETILRIPEQRRSYSLRRSWVFRQDQPVSQILVLRDISERIRSEQDLLEAKSLAEEANHAKSEFLANMSHELRTPLHHIIGFTELVSNRQIGELTQTQAEYLQDVLDSARNLLALINDVVEITKIDTGMLTVQHDPTYLPDILEATFALLREKAIKHGIDISMDAGSFPESILLDSRKVKQALFNVLGKALALTPDGGQIHVQVRIKSEGTEMKLETRVDCYDVNLSEHDLEGIFNPFEQVKADSDHLDISRGSGLALAKRLVELLGGRIRAESGQNNRGTIFVFELPVSANS
jgi:PAS domain S-box-containing protein